MENADDEAAATAAADIVRRDRGQTFPVLPVTAYSTPSRQPRLKLRNNLTERELEEAHAAVQRLGHELHTFTITTTDVEDWKTAEGYLSALTPTLYSTLLPFAQHQRPPPPCPSQPAIRKARRRAGCIRSAMRRTSLRKKFRTHEKACMQQIFAGAKADPEHAGGPAAPTRCPIPKSTVHEYFQGVNTPQHQFNFDDEAGEPFRQLLVALPPASAAMDALTSVIVADEV
ncbi:hypothetical protein PHYSODRAFT_502138, partial [Phytophthora sojae]